jgi:hypothetical protein
MENCTLSNDDQINKSIAKLVVNKETIKAIQLVKLDGPNNSFVSVFFVCWFNIQLIF